MAIDLVNLSRKEIKDQLVKIIITETPSLVCLVEAKIIDLQLFHCFGLALTRITTEAFDAGYKQAMKDQKENTLTT